MKQLKYFAMIGIAMFVAVACSSTKKSKILEWVPSDIKFPLSGTGPHYVGVREYFVIDESRDNRQIKLEVWYPAKNETDYLSRRDAPVYQTDAPYPLILTGPDTGEKIFGGHLVSHGYVMAIVDSPGSGYRWEYDMMDFARDLLFALDQLAIKPPEDLKGIIDTDNVGVAGYSGEGNTAFAVSGARLDPDFYRSQCDQVPVLYPTIFYFWSYFACSLTENWDAFASAAGKPITESDDDLWQPITDGRIKAIASMAAAAPWMYGERGLAAVDRPVLVISPTEDEYDPHAMVTDTFEQIGSPDKVMISFIDQSHETVLLGEYQERINHFVTAFFGYYLQGRDDYAEYYSEDFVAQFDDLAWGVYSPE